MRIALDAMGGDFGPSVLVDGAVSAARDLPAVQKLFLVGDRSALEAELARYSNLPASLEIVHAPEVVGMDEAPTVALRKKKNSSITQAVELVKKGEAEAVFSAGSTGAAVAVSTVKLRTLEGIDRPAIAAVIPTQKEPCLLLDAGANPDCTPAMLAQFALMGTIYSREILGISAPNAGLLSIGGEAAKGNEITKEAFAMLSASSLEFAGNVESSDMFAGRVSVVVCDGFVGNVVLKTSESVGKAIGHWLKAELTKNPLRMAGALLIKGGLNTLRHKLDPATYGGAPLLGVRGVCIIGHGSSSATAVRNGIRVASEAVDHHVNHLIEEKAAELKVSE